MSGDGRGTSRADPFDLPDASGFRVGIIGGTGEQGRGLGLRWAIAGLDVTLGSRDPQRAESAAAHMQAMVADAGLTDRPVGDAPLRVRGGSNDLAAAADVVVLAVPWAAHGATITELAATLEGRIVVDCVNPLGFDAQGAFPIRVPEGSAAEQAQSCVPGASVVGAFHHISAALLTDVRQPRIEADVMVVGDDRRATDVVQALAGVIPGMRGIYAGRLRNAGQLEALTANLISTNRRYRSHAGIRITDV